MLATILALVMALSLCTSAWATSEETSESTGATAGTETGGTGANGTEGGKTSSEENGGQATTYVAQIGEMKYETLQAAVNAASRKATVKLLADTKENVTISTPYVTLDLNGHTLNGSTGERKPALTITARVTVKDSSAEKTGTIMREDTAENSGVSSHPVFTGIACFPIGLYRPQCHLIVVGHDKFDLFSVLADQTIHAVLRLSPVPVR